MIKVLCGELPKKVMFGILYPGDIFQWTEYVYMKIAKYGNNTPNAVAFSESEAPRATYFSDGIAVTVPPVITIIISNKKEKDV